MTDCYLKANIQIEPLVWNWYAHPLIIPPINCGMMFLNHYIRIMQSFIDAPEIHSAAVKNPKLIGGTFINLESNDTSKVQYLLNIIKDEYSLVLTLAKDIKAFDQLLQTLGDGFSLENVYQSIPTTMKGCIELVYDSHNNPMTRFIEPLIYQKYYNSTPQSILLSNSISDSRSFVLSTPRFAQNDSINIPIALNDERLDILFRSRSLSQNFSKIMNLFNLSSNEREIYKNFFAIGAPLLPNDRSYKGAGVRVRYFGHACVFLQSCLTSILIDPIIPYNGINGDRFTYLDLPDDIDYVLLTHAHQDHTSIETLIQIRHKVKHVVIPSNNKGFILDPSLKLMLQNLGFHSLLQLDEFDEITLQDGTILSIPFLGEHGDLNIHTKSAYYINIKNETFLFAADSNVLDENLYKNIFDYTGMVKNLFLGMECVGAPMSWVYASFFTSPMKKSQDESRRLSGANSQKALSLISHLGCNNIYIYAMGREPWLSHIMALDYSCDTPPQILEAKYFIEKAKEREINASLLLGKKEWVL